MIFVDTGVWFALLVPSDADHALVEKWFEETQEPLVSTDYILDELLTLLRARGEPARALAAGSAFLDGSLCQVLTTSWEDFLAAWDIFQRYSDKDWSFTDCLSYAVIQQLRIETAASLDHHFHQFGTVNVVPTISTESF